MEVDYDIVEGEGGGFSRSIYAKIGSTVIGHSGYDNYGLNLEGFTRDKTARLSSIFVDPDFRESSVGYNLLRVACSSAKENSFRDFVVTAAVDDVSDFYKKSFARLKEEGVVQSFFGKFKMHVNDLGGIITSHYFDVKLD